MSEIETFCAGHPLKYAMEGVAKIPSRERRSNKSLEIPIEDEYGTSIDEDTASVIKRLYSAKDATALVESVKAAGLDDVEEYDRLFQDLDEDETADLGRVMEALDMTFAYGLAPRNKEASKVSSKRQRESIYIPELINDLGDGDVYMAKTLSTTTKVRIAWDLHDENQIIVVDDYDKWEQLLGWKKLKSLPHGKNKIREELGDRLSADVLNIVASEDTSSSDDDSNDTGSKGRRTRTKPSDEVLNVARSSRNKHRTKIESQDILETFEDGDNIGSAYTGIDMLILFPTTTDLNMTDHWWVPGSRWADVGNAAIANCNKGTFEYLNQSDNVWHIEDYLEQAKDYEFETNHGPVTMDTIDESKLVLHVVEQDMRSKLMANKVIENLPELLPEYCDNQMYNSPDFPHPDDMLYAPVTKEEVFWLRPELLGTDGVVLYGSTKPRNVGTTSSLSSDYKLYARARLPDWDFDSTEMSTLDNASYKLDLDSGGFEIIETLAKLHDNGMKPYSETPEARWMQ